MFHTIFYEPILNLLVWIYNIMPGQDIGLAIIVLTVIIKVILYPLSSKALRSQRAMQTLQPKMEEIKIKHKDNKDDLSKAMMALYKTEKINPFSSCLPLLIQLPFFWAVFRVFRNELVTEKLTGIYSFITNPGILDPMAFGLINFAEPSLVLAILAGLAQFGQAKMMPKPKKATGGKQDGMGAIMTKQMTYFMPIITVVISMSLPSGLAFYWFLTTVLTIGQQMFLFKQLDKEEQAKNKVIEGEVAE